MAEGISAGLRPKIAVIGGGFYGCSLALCLRDIADSVVVLERETSLFARASRVNQARVHTGFHYPRSFMTALRSKALQARFVRDFEGAIHDEFVMLYAIARHKSKVTAKRFLRMFEEMNAPIRMAAPADEAMFDPDTIEAVFACGEYAFDWTALREDLVRKLSAAGVSLRTGFDVARLEPRGQRIDVVPTSGAAICADMVFNVTYSGINRLLGASDMPSVPMKHELTEIALMTPPDSLSSRGVTVMDGPFFSFMPYPARSLHSLTHVRYTPHFSWVDRGPESDPYAIAAQLPFESRAAHMVADATRYLPSLAEARYDHSIVDIKTVLTANEDDDGRPILLRKHEELPGLISVMGAKIDNIYDLLDALPEVDSRLRGISDRALLASGSRNA